MTTETAKIIVAVSLIYSLIIFVCLCIVAYKYYKLLQQIRRLESEPFPKDINISREKWIELYKDTK